MKIFFTVIIAFCGLGLSCRGSVKAAEAKEHCERPNRLYPLLVQERDRAAQKVTLLEKKCKQVEIQERSEKAQMCQKELVAARQDHLSIVEALADVPKVLLGTPTDNEVCKNQVGN